MTQSFLSLAFIVALYALVAAPVAEILRRTGFSRWWCLVVFLPPLNLVMLWVFANKRWPAVDGPLTISESLKRHR
jgi:predicted ABC-type exoprotein transport system permease subunit